MDCSFIQVMKVLGECKRLRIIKLLQERKCCVCELVGILGLSYATISGHLKKMKAAGLIIEEKSSYWTYYELNPELSHQSKALLKIISEMECDTCRRDREKLITGSYVCDRPGRKEKA